jgi:hypothetical protein
MANWVPSDFAFGPNESCYFNYADLSEAFSAGRFESDLDSPIIKASCMVWSPDGWWAAVCQTANGWYFSEHDLKLKSASTNRGTTVGQNVPDTLKEFVSNGHLPGKLAGDRDGPSLKITAGPNKSWFAFDGMFPSSKRYNSAKP